LAEDSVIKFVIKGNLTKTKSYLKKNSKSSIADIMRSCGKQGVDALRNATPVRTGLVASSWSYSVTVKNELYTISWNNSDLEDGFPVAVMIQYGYGTGTGGYVEGQDYINPAIKPIFKDISNKVRKAVTSR
jgi:hypothetical protein